MAIQEPGAGNIAGIDYANKHVLNPANQIFDIKKGAEKHPDTKKGSVYWDFGSGALGQYYAGSLLLLRLIKVQDRYFFSAESGKELGIAFEKNISPEAKQFLFQTIESGQLARKEVLKLSDFSLQKIKPKSAEWSYYIQLFFSTDSPAEGGTVNDLTTYRRDTWLDFIQYLLTCKEEREWRYFPQHVYAQKGFGGTREATAASAGWYYYSANEYIHFGLEAIFSIILRSIEEEPLHINKLLSELREMCVDALHGYHDFSDTILTRDFLDFVADEPLTNEYPGIILEHLNDESWDEVMAWAIELLLKVYKETLPDHDLFNRFTYNTNTRDKRGTALEFFEEHITPFLEMPFLLFVERTISKIINDHLYVAYIKMGNGEGQVHKMLLEDNYLVHIANIDPRFTTPRLGTVRNFLIDLALMQVKNGKYLLTEEGETIYKQYKLK
ncbi:MAG: hypothetical protein GXC73_12580 [Chitinophagaceae bacterium]|nr:hypothetical protein [Chitinophagaceae bacterium]